MSRFPAGHRRSAWIAIAIVVIAAAVVWGARAWHPPPSHGNTQPRAGMDRLPPLRGDAGGLTVYPPVTRPHAPNVSGTTLDGKRLSLTNLSGHLVVLNAWGSWCGPCRGEAPVLARVARESAGQGVRFVGIDTRDTAGAAKAFERYFKIPYPSIVDTDGQVLLALKGYIPLSGVPSTLLMDRTGRIMARVVGPTDYPTLHGLITDEIKRSGSSSSAPGSGTKQ